MRHGMPTRDKHYKTKPCFNHLIRDLRENIMYIETDLDMCNQCENSFLTSSSQSESDILEYW